MSTLNFSWHDKVMILFAILFSGVFVFEAGQQAEQRFYAASVVNVLLAAFFFSIMAAIAAGKWSEFNDRVEDARRDEEHKAMNAMKAVVDTLAEADEARRHQENLEELLQAVIKDVTKDKKIKASDLPKIEKAFHENTGDHFLRLNLHGSGQLEVQISEKPFPEAEKPKRKAQPARANIEKPLTKSQERRIAASKKASK